VTVEKTICHDHTEQYHIWCLTEPIITNLAFKKAQKVLFAVTPRAYGSRLSPFKTVQNSLKQRNRKPLSDM